MAFIRFEDVTVRYAHTVFEDLNLNINNGEFVCIIGETGCGKSTLLRMLLGSERPSRGRVTVDGQLICHPDRDRGYVPQKYSLFPDKTVIRNVAFGPIAESFSLLKLLSPKWWKHRAGVYREASETLRHVGLLDRDNTKFPDQLSGGMQQRVAIAQSLIMHPRILLMDESFSALDPNTRRGMQTLIRSIWRESGMTVVFVTHNLAEAVHLGTRVIKLEKGGIALDLPVPENLQPRELDNLMHRLDDGHQSHLAEALPAMAL